eukprot:1158167-Pelagomonas_calceolata.AAC.4
MEEKGIIHTIVGHVAASPPIAPHSLHTTPNSEYAYKVRVLTLDIGILTQCTAMATGFQGRIKSYGKGAAREGRSCDITQNKLFGNLLNHDAKNAATMDGWKLLGHFLVVGSPQYTARQLCIGMKLVTPMLLALPCFALFSQVITSSSLGASTSGQNLYPKQPMLYHRSQKEKKTA